MNGLREDRLRTDLADVAGLARVVDLHDRALASSRRARIRTTVAAVAAAVVLASAGTAAVLWSGPLDSANVPPGGSLEPTTLPTGTVESASDGVVMGDPGPLSPTRELTLPAWPGEPECPSGDLEVLKRGAIGDRRRPDVNAIIIKTVVADVNRDGAPDVVANLECTRRGQPGYQVVAITGVDGGGRLRTLGRIAATGEDGVAAIYDLAVEPDGSVRVNVGDRPAGSSEGALTQWREYKWAGESFVPTGGAADFPADPPAVALSVSGDFEVVTDDDRRRLDVRLTAANTGSAGSAPLLVWMAVPNRVRPAGGGWGGCLVDPSESAEGYVVLQCRRPALAPGATWTASYQLIIEPGPAAAFNLVQMAVFQEPGGPVERARGDNVTDFTLP
jgi:hypothetical protein